MKFHVLVLKENSWISHVNRILLYKLSVCRSTRVNLTMCLFCFDFSLNFQDIQILHMIQNAYVV